MKSFESGGQFEDAEESEQQEQSESEGSQEDDFDSRKEEVEHRSERVEREVVREQEIAKESVSETVWARPVQFVEDVISDKLVPYFKKFLKKFGAVEDEALATKEMRDVRDQAKDVSEDGE